MTGLYVVFLALGLVFLSVQQMVPLERARPPFAGIVAAACFVTAALLATLAVT